MNRDILKILGIISSVIYIITALYSYFNPTFTGIHTNQSYSFRIFLQIINLLAFITIFFSASEIIKEFSTINISSAVYALAGFKIFYFILSFIVPDFHIEINKISLIYDVTYIIIILILAVIAIKSIKIKDKELNIIFFKIFVFGILFITLITTAFNYFYISGTLKMNNILSNISKYILLILYITPYFFAAVFFIKRLKIEQTN